MSIQKTDDKEIVHISYWQQSNYVKTNVSLMVNRIFWLCDLWRFVCLSCLVNLCENGDDDAISWTGCNNWSNICNSTGNIFKSQLYYLPIGMWILYEVNIILIFRSWIVYIKNIVKKSIADCLNKEQHFLYNIQK